jgi:hypothetical protein
VGGEKKDKMSLFHKVLLGVAIAAFALAALRIAGVDFTWRVLLSPFRRYMELDEVTCEGCGESLATTSDDAGNMLCEGCAMLAKEEAGEEVL